MTVHKSASVDELLWLVSAPACVQCLAVGVYMCVFIMPVLSLIYRSRDLLLCSAQKSMPTLRDVRVHGLCVYSNRVYFSGKVIAQWILLKHDYRMIICDLTSSNHNFNAQHIFQRISFVHCQRFLVGIK